MGILSVATGALNAAQTGILTTGHNIANASTPGYNRQEIVQGTNIANLTGSGYIGSGTHIQTVKRVYDEFLGRQILAAEAGASEMASYLSQIQQMDNLLADPDAGLSPALAGFFKGVQEVAANPASVPGRQSMLSAAQSLSARFQALDLRMSEIRNGLNSQIYSQVESINTFAQQIANLNERIVIAEAGSVSQQPNDLYDEREQKVREMNQLVRVTTVRQADGSHSLFIGNGQPMVVGSQAYSLVTTLSNDDPERFVVSLKSVGGATIQLPESQVSGGSLGGMLSFRSVSLDPAQNALGRVAVTFAKNFNDQHALGMDLTGKLGGQFFNVATPVLRVNSLNIGIGSPTVAFDNPTLSQLSGSDYRLTSSDGLSFQLLRLSDNKVTQITAVPQVVDGLSIDTSTWTPGAGDNILIQPTRDGAKTISVAMVDPRGVAAALPIRTKSALTNTGTAAIDSGKVTNTAKKTTFDFQAFDATTYPNGKYSAFDKFNATGELNPPIVIKFDSPATDPMTYSIYDKTAYDADPTNAVALAGGANLVFTAGANLFPDAPAFPEDYGYQVTISGAPAAGDIFTIEGNKNGVADNRNAMLLGALQTAETMLGGATFGPTASYQSAYSQIVSAVGSKSAEVQTIGQAQQGLADYSVTSMQQRSGVNLDEEAANLLRYQQAYQAAAKIIEIAGRVFDEVIALGR